ncbi:MAG: hypothetical protein ACREPD_04990 [Stenotrophomonas sp.]|uniref:hypothetical protein n=1 Tax=Stenotrophomonas sp. TaxID=69392 RepID=UPI003D6CA1B4
MAKIPQGNFGQGAGQAPVVQTRVSGAGRDAVAQAVGELADTGSRIANHAQVLQEQEARRQKTEDEALARAKAANAQLDYEIEVQDRTLATQDAVVTGGLNYEQAKEQYAAEIGKIKAPEVQGLAPDMQIAYERGIQRTQRSGELKINSAVQKAQRADLQTQYTSALDKLGKIGGMPGADIDAVNLRADSLAQLGKAAGLSDVQISKTMQDFRDRNWTSQATQRAIQAREDPEGLAKLEHDLADPAGFYADKLDPEKRNALWSQVSNRQQTLIDKAERAQDRLDAKGNRVIDQIDKQIASGVPAKPDQWASWSDAVKGTAAEAEFSERVAQEQVVQKVLRMSPDQQQTYVQAAEASLLSDGGSVVQKANLDRLKTAVTTNLAQMLDAPLLFNASREGGEVEPLKLEALASPADAWELGAQLSERQATIDGMRKRYGTQVSQRLLLPQETKVLADTLKNSTATQQVSMLGQLRTAVMDDKVFNRVMQQIAPDEPVVAYAGMLATKERASVTLAEHWLKANVTAGARDVSATMLEGNRLLQGKGDSKFPLPPEKNFREQFTAEIGGATSALFAGRPGAAEVAMQAVRAYYTGKSAADGDQSGEVDGKRMKQAIRASLGEIADVNGRGEVLAPWGMSEDEFEDRAAAAFVTAARAAKLSDSTVNNFRAFGLRQAGENTFYVISGMSYLYGENGQPVILNIYPGSAP